MEVTLMRLLILNIFEEIADFSSKDFNVSQKGLYKNTYLLPDSISDNVEHEVLKLILKLQGDGVKIYTSKHNQICYMDVFLLVKEYKLDDIIGYFNNNFQTIDFSVILRKKLTTTRD